MKKSYFWEIILNVVLQYFRKSFSSPRKTFFKAGFTGMTIAALAFANKTRFSNMFENNSYCEKEKNE